MSQLTPDPGAAEPLRRYYHTAMKAMYEEVAPGVVKVTDKEGRTGVFSWKGPWIEGELTQANIHMLLLCGGPWLPKDFRYHWTETPEDPRRPSGWPEMYETLLPHQMGTRARARAG